MEKLLEDVVEGDRSRGQCLGHVASGCRVSSMWVTESVMRAKSSPTRIDALSETGRRHVRKRSPARVTNVSSDRAFGNRRRCQDWITTSGGIDHQNRRADFSSSRVTDAESRTTLRKESARSHASSDKSPRVKRLHLRGLAPLRRLVRAAPSGVLFFCAGVTCPPDVMMLLCASVVTGAGTLIGPTQTRVDVHALSEPAGLVVLGAGFVLLAA